MHADHMSLRQQFLQRLRRTHPQRLVPALRHMRIIEDHVHAQRLGSQCSRRTDAANADHPTYSPTQPMHRHHLGVMPRTLVAAQAAVQHVDAPRESHHHCDVSVRLIFGAVVGDIRDIYPPAARGGAVHIIDTHSAAND